MCSCDAQKCLCGRKIINVFVARYSRIINGAPHGCAMVDWRKPEVKQWWIYTVNQSGSPQLFDGLLVDSAGPDAWSQFRVDGHKISNATIKSVVQAKMDMIGEVNIFCVRGVCGRTWPTTSKCNLRVWPWPDLMQLSYIFPSRMILRGLNHTPYRTTHHHNCHHHTCRSTQRHTGTI